MPAGEALRARGLHGVAVRGFDDVRNVPHEATAGPEGAVVIDVFAPVREDWVALDEAEPREPRWP